MSKEEWDEIKSIFAAALELPTSERADYLEAACADRPGVRDVVSDLIANHDSQDSFYPEANLRGARAFADQQLVGERFRIERFIDRGGMGEVYEARDERLGLRVALKTVRHELAQDRLALERFRREILIAREVAHESICRIFDLVEHKSGGSTQVIPCLSMELLAGESLGQYLTKHRPLPVSLALPWIRQIAAALQVLHTKEIVHRDLKPSNIMLVPGRNGTIRAVVMDFGLARQVRKDPETSMFETRAELQAGAPYFMAPEVLCGERPSIASDVYAFGLLVDEMVTRSRAFTAQSMHLLLYQKLWEKPIALSDRVDNLPEGWHRFILKCLEPAPGDRFQTIGEALAFLENPVAAPPPARRFTRRKLAAAAATVPVLTAGAIFASLALKPLSAGMTVFQMVNETGQSQYDYICNITDSELMRRLSGVPGIGAVAYYAPRSGAAAKFDTRLILEGRLTAVANGYRMILRLTDNGKGRVFWTHEFDPFNRPGALDLQTEITQRVIEAVDNFSTFGASDSVIAGAAPLVTPFRKWFGSEPTRIPGTTTMNSEAWEHYSRAHQLLDKDNERSILAGINLLKKATETDPNFALGFAALSRAYILLSSEVGHDAHQALDDAESYAFKSLACDRQLAEPHAFLAAVQQNRWEWTDSTVNFSKALKLRPRYPQALRWFAGLSVQFGNFQEGLARSAEAIQIDPYGVPNYLCHGMYLRFARRFEEAIQVYKTPGVEAAVLDNLGMTYAWLGYVNKGSTREHWFQLAFQAADQMEVQLKQEGTLDTTQEAAQDGSNKLSDVDHLRMHLYALSGDGARAQRYLARMEQAMNIGQSAPAEVAQIYSVMGDQKTAVELLERAYVMKDPALMFIKVEPELDAVRQHPQVQSIIRAMKLV